MKYSLEPSDRIIFVKGLSSAKNMGKNIEKHA